jgi:hypothetical protein
VVAFQEEGKALRPGKNPLSNKCGFESERKHIKWAGMGGPLLPRSPSLPSLYAPVKIHKQPSVFIELSTV